MHDDHASTRGRALSQLSTPAEVSDLPHLVIFAELYPGGIGMCRASVSALGEQQSDDVGFLNGAHVLLGQHVKLRAPLFAALAIMALARPSALLELHGARA